MTRLGDKGTIIFFLGSIFLQNNCMEQKQLGIEKILERWTRSAVQELDKDLPHITEICRSFSQDDLNTLKMFPQGLSPEEEINLTYWKNSSIREFLYSYSDISTILSTTVRQLRSEVPQQEKIPSTERKFWLQKIKGFENKSELHVIGDLHGGFGSAVSFFLPHVDENLVISDKRKQFLVLGDITDGGPYSVETFVFLLILYLKNQKNINLIRGNHERKDLNQRYGFAQELFLKYGNQWEVLFDKFCALYEWMPIVLFGFFPDTKLIIPFCHGSIDVGKRKAIVDGDDDEVDYKLIQEFFSKIVQNKVNEYYLYVDTDAYLWNDHCITALRETYICSETGRLHVSKKDTEEYCSSCAPKGWIMPYVCRAHQHTLVYADLMPLFFANHVAYLWDRHNPSVFTLCLCPGCCGGVANNEFSFPGVITLTTGVVSEDGKLFTVFKHPNMHIAPDIKEKHCAMLSELLWIDLNDPERKNLDWYDTIREHFKVYRDFVHGGMTSVYTEEGIENFLKYTVDVEKAEMVAQWRFDETLQRMNLVQFFLPAALKKLRDQRDAQKKQQENEQQYAAQVQKLKKRIGGGVLVGFAALAGVLLHYKEKIAARIVRKQIKKAAYF